MSEGHSKDLLASYVRRAKAILDQVRDLQADMRDLKKEAKGDGFDGTKIGEVARWQCKVEKHGREVVDESEAIFDLYRTVVDGKAAKFDDMMDTARDRALLKIFAPEDQVEQKLNRRRADMNKGLALIAGRRAAEQ
ncbi:GapR family DNA-binding domain-containing protein [Sphingomonas sp. Leaf257]|uniref:GapR family DNA-binding domain-containing protein n=1 Tax=Sphingomonas sp. Leaf257 TaxID=1736309 RepID=UPI0006FB8A31|nr:GapR family DNA-binding domain-containing protein [Sphingomonas sp. Leaf257]KQO57683.1 hypothetical protein ASF14_14720 [Sphingomonas sp. Leaf257]